MRPGSHRATRASRSISSPGWLGAFPWVLAQTGKHRARVYAERPDGSRRFGQVTIPSGAGVVRLPKILALDIGRYLEPPALLERSADTFFNKLLRGFVSRGPVVQVV